MPWTVVHQPPQIVNRAWGWNSVFIVLNHTCACVCMSSRFSHVWLFVTVWTTAHRAPLSMGFSRQESWSELPFPSTRNLPNARIKPRSPALQEDSSPPEPAGKPRVRKHMDEMKVQHSCSDTSLSSFHCKQTLDQINRATTGFCSDVTKPCII